MLRLILAVREKNIEVHMAAERVLITKCFAFGHFNYARYLTVKSMPSQQNWGEYADTLLKFCWPPSQSNPLQLEIIFDSYSTATIKELTQ